MTRPWTGRGVRLIWAGEVWVGQLVHLPIATYMTTGPVGLIVLGLILGASSSARHLLMSAVSRGIAALKPGKSTDL